MSEMTCPIKITYRRPKISLSEPANEKDTEEAIDQPLTTQPRFAKSPRSVPMAKRIETATIKPQEMGDTTDSPKNYLLQSCTKTMLKQEDLLQWKARLSN